MWGQFSWTNGDTGNVSESVSLGSVVKNGVQSWLMIAAAMTIGRTAGNWSGGLQHHVWNLHIIPQQAFNAALMGLLPGLVVVHSRSLFSSMAFHFCTYALALLYSRNALPVTADGLFFSRDNLDDIRYGAPVLLICVVCVL